MPGPQQPEGSGGRGFSDHEALIATLTAARDADPRRAPFGVVISDPWEGGDQQFFWYPSRQALEFALLDAHAFVDPEAFAEDQGEWVEPRFDLDAALLEIDELGPAQAEALDEITGDFYGIVWIGHFADLVQGDDPFSRRLRAALRLAEGDEQPDDEPLEEFELPAFVELLAAFGDPG